MAKTKKHGSIKRFGPRYGRKLKNRLGAIEGARKKLDKCPYCLKKGVKRLSVGIWRCDKCESKFTGRAYTPGKIVVKVESKESTA